MFTVKSENDQPVQLKKVNEYGEYIPFPGVTVISACYPEQKEFCETIYKALVKNPSILNYFAPLPAESYHMTTMSLETEHQIGLDWTQFINDNLSRYKNMNQVLQKNPIYPSIERMEVRIGWSISLTLHLPQQQKIHIKETAESLNIEKTIPKVFHMTLAYSIPNTTIPEELKSEITKELNAVIGNIQLPIKIARPTLCYFHDMTSFPVWDAEKNPFTQTSFSSHRLFSFISDETNKTTASSEKVQESTLAH